MKCVAIALLALTACERSDALTYPWDDRRVLCSEAVDDLSDRIDFAEIDERLAESARAGWVTLLHAHKPGETVSRGALEHLFGEAERLGLDFVRFDELSPDQPHRAGLAFAFDDDDVGGWMSVRDILDAHAAHVTFFVTRWHLLSATSEADIDTLASEGHDIEAHSWDHVSATDYVHDHSLADYLNDQALPSISIMESAGYHPTSYALPFGSTDAAINAALLEHVPRVRTTPGPCPN